MIDPEERSNASPQRVDEEFLRRAFLRCTIVLYGFGFLVSLVLSFVLPGPRIEAFPGPLSESRSWLGLGQHLFLGLAAGIVVVLLGRVGSGHSRWLDSLEREFASYFTWMRGTWDVFLLAAFSAVGEEALFRGLLQPRLGLLLGSLVFASCHIPLSRKLAAWPFFAFLVGLLLGWLFEGTGGRLAAPVLAHFTINFLNLRTLLRKAGPGMRVAGGASGTPFAESPLPFAEESKGTDGEDKHASQDGNRELR